MSNTAAPARRATFPALAPATCACGQTQTSAEEAGVPIACDLTVFTAVERAEHLARSERLFAAIARVKEAADGYELTFAATPARRAELWHWIEAERRCCPFFRFAVRELRDGTRIALAVSGPGAAKETLRAAFHDLRAGVDLTAPRST